MEVKFFDIQSWNEQQWFNTGGTRDKKYVQSPEGEFYYFKTSNRWIIVKLQILPIPQDKGSFLLPLNASVFSGIFPIIPEVKNLGHLPSTIEDAEF